MGLIDFLKKKRDFAEEFKTAFENKDYNVLSIFDEWTESKNYDSNYYYAKALIFAGSKSKSLDDVYKEYEKAQCLGPNNENLEPWFKSMAWQYVKMKADEEGKLKVVTI